MLKDFSSERFDILIQAGQSNSEGYGFGPADEPYEPNELVWNMNGNFTISVAAEKVTGNEIQSSFIYPFARRYLNAGLLAEGRKILILRTAVGGTGFLDHRWGETEDLYLRMMEMIRTALELNPENRLVAFLWHQGETDACLKATRDGHYANLRSLFEKVRDTFRVPDLPMIAGDFVPQWKEDNIGICAPVIQAIRDVCQDLAHCGFVTTEGLKSNLQELNRDPLGWTDTIHFSRKSTYLLADRYFDEYCRLSEQDR